jgi:aspartate/methionine/tyrosine aminotransferase
MQDFNNKFSRILPKSGIRSVFDRAKEIEGEGKIVCHLEIGRPCWPSFPGTVDAVTAALTQGFVHYIPNRGILELRQALSSEIKNTIGIKFDPATELIVTTGASEAVCMCALALLGADDEVIIPQPAWNHYQAVAEMAGAKVIPLNLSSDNNFLIDINQLKSIISSKTKMIVLNSPANPTGVIQPPEILKNVAEIALRNGIFVLSDEVYQDFVYGDQHCSIAKYMGDSDLFIYINSLSKSYVMTGWRIGYIAARANVSDILNRIHQYLTVCGVSFAQKGAVSLFNNQYRHEYLKEMKKGFSEKLNIWLASLKGIPEIDLVVPKGAFYLFPKINYKNMSGREFCEFMLEKHGVAMVPGDVFGEVYSSHIRISYGGEIETQKRAIQKFIEVFDENK